MKNFGGRKQRGIVATKFILKGHIICEYKGIIRTIEEGLKVANKSEHKETYMVKVENSYYIDATEEKPTLARLFNHTPMNDEMCKCF